VKCPYCGKVIQGLGRKTLPVGFNIVYKAFQLNKKGKPDLTNTALMIKEETGIKVSPAFVLLRLRKEAVVRGITYDELVTQLVTKGKIKKRRFNCGKED